MANCWGLVRVEWKEPPVYAVAEECGQASDLLSGCRAMQVMNQLEWQAQPVFWVQLAFCLGAGFLSTLIPARPNWVVLAGESWPAKLVGTREGWGRNSNSILEVSMSYIIIQ